MRHRLRVWRSLRRLPTDRYGSIQERVGLCVLRVERRVGGAVYTTYLIDDLAGDGPTNVATTGTLDVCLERIRAFAETLCAHDSGR